ncbi:hypothetical protein [Sphingomonas carotinifaciens]|uniref:hypothetical protein n=1 Tax=Sphingomonas carotinifaciens TaxID=1166323 RepID=UPI0019681E23|nr:hypothetical protein [Sphingomonas carotinifaciens]
MTQGIALVVKHIDVDTLTTVACRGRPNLEDPRLPVEATMKKENRNDCLVTSQHGSSAPIYHVQGKQVKVAATGYSAFGIYPTPQCLVGWLQFLPAPKPGHPIIRPRIRRHVNCGGRLFCMGAVQDNPSLNEAGPDFSLY